MVLGWFGSTVFGVSWLGSEGIWAGTILRRSNLAIGLKHCLYKPYLHKVWIRLIFPEYRANRLSQVGKVKMYPMYPKYSQDLVALIDLSKKLDRIFLLPLQTYSKPYSLRFSQYSFGLHYTGWLFYLIERSIWCARIVSIAW